MRDARQPRRLRTAGQWPKDVRRHGTDSTRNGNGMKRHTSDRHRLLPSGKRLGNYTIESKLADGHLASVYLAKKPTGEQFALKVMDAGADHRAHLWGEYEILSRVKHAHIVKVYDWGEDDGCVYYAMEYLSGEALRFFVMAGHLVYAVSMGLFEDVLEAAAHLHQHGVTHNDIEPTNIRIREVDDGQAVLIDFGSARSADRGEERSPWGDVPGGAIQFASPEHAAFLQGVRTHYIPTRPSEVYSLGVFLYFLLTGTWPVPPPQGSDEHFDFLQRVRTSTPRHPRKVVPHAPQHISLLVMKMLQLDPALRPADAGIVLKEFREACEKDKRALRSPMPIMRIARFMANQQILAKPSDPGDAQVEKAQATGDKVSALSAYFDVLTRRLGRARPPAPAAPHERSWSSQALVALTVASCAATLLALAIVYWPPSKRLQILDVPLKSRQVFLTGKRMPDKPEPGWMRAPKGARDGIDGCPARLPSTVFNGTCWRGGANPYRMKPDPTPEDLKAPCPDGWYDPPPHALAEHKDRCFDPILVDGKAVEKK